jgi:hypothetical protein
MIVLKIELDDDNNKYDITAYYEEPKFEFDEKKEEYINTHIQELKETYNYLMNLRSTEKL